MVQSKRLTIFLASLLALGVWTAMPVFAADEPPPSIDDVGPADAPPPSPTGDRAAAGIPDSGIADPGLSDAGLPSAAVDTQALSPDEYLIQKGDTLWDVSGRFFGKSQYWPKLWSFNQYITNPHYIFPGNRLVFKPGTETEPPSVSVKVPGEPNADLAKTEKVPGEGTLEQDVPKEGAMEGDIGKEIAAAEKDGNETLPSDGGESKVGRRGEVTLREDGYISQQPEKSIGTIVASTSLVAMLAEGHEVYLKFNQPGSVQMGDRYTVFRQEKKVKGLGFLNKNLGFVEVIEIGDKGVKARILRSFYDMARGDTVKVYDATFHKVPIVEASNKVDAKIIERLNYDAQDIGYGDTIYLDKGNKDGVEPGYEFLVVRRGDGLTFENSQKGGSNLPEEIVGKVVVVVARNNNSTAVVTYSTQSLYIGDKVSTQLVR